MLYAVVYSLFDDNVVDLGTPSMPVGPLSATETTANSCKLSWKPPEHDGNSKLLGYCVEKRDAKKMTWAFVTRTSDTSTEITGLSDSSSYYFRVCAENALGTGPPLEIQQPVQPKKAESEAASFYYVKKIFVPIIYPASLRDPPF